MFRRDSVVEPASAVVSATITFWIVLIFLLSTLLSMPSSGKGGEVHRGDNPVDGERIDDDEHDAHQCGKQDADRRRDQPFDIRTHFLQFPEGLSAALVFEDGIGKLKRVAQSVGVELRSQTLGDDVDEIVLEVLRYPGNERYADGGGEEEADAPDELSGGILTEPGRVLIDDIPEDQGVEE